jgi:hypothetical protein
MPIFMPAAAPRAANGRPLRASAATAARRNPRRPCLKLRFKFITNLPKGKSKVVLLVMRMAVRFLIDLTIVLVSLGVLAVQY